MHHEPMETTCTEAVTALAVIGIITVLLCLVAAFSAGSVGVVNAGEAFSGPCSRWKDRSRPCRSPAMGRQACVQAPSWWRDGTMVTCPWPSVQGRGSGVGSSP